MRIAENASTFVIVAAVAITVLAFNGFYNSNTAELITTLSRPIYFYSPQQNGPAFVATPFFFIEKNATYLVGSVAIALALASGALEFRRVKTQGRNSISAGYISLSLVLVVLNAMLLRWNT